MVIQPDSDTTISYPSLADIQSNTSWEAHGLEGLPGFLQYDISDHDIFDGSWPDFHITTASTNVIDLGTENLPETLVNLLQKYSIQDERIGIAYDIGRYELNAP